MLERKFWTSKQDQVLKYLYENKNVKKWNLISKTMIQKYNMFGRSGKQCRERYYNHLATNINQDIWSIDEFKYLLQLHNQMGNKWSSIAKQLQGRTSNSVKNAFFGVLRKNVVNLNKFIKKNFKNKKNLKLTIIPKIIAGAQMIYRKHSKDQAQISNECSRLKNQLYNLSESYIFQTSNFTCINKLIDDINSLSKKRRKTKKKVKYVELSECENNQDQDFFEEKSSISIQEKQQILIHVNENQSILSNDRKNFQKQQQQIIPQKLRTYQDNVKLQSQSNLPKISINQDKYQSKIVINNASNLQYTGKICSLNSIDYFMNDILI